MKKTIENVLMHLRGTRLSPSDEEEIPFGKEIISRFDQWVETKGYCRADESMRDVCTRLNISRFELGWVCRRVYGDTFPSLRKRLRICESERLLLEFPEASAAMVGEMVGIHDRTNFRRQFEEVCGMSPQRWRDTHLPR